MPLAAPAAGLAEAEDAARQIMAADPAVSSGYARGELRPFRIALLRGRD